MSERRMRRVVVVAMIMWLFLPFNRPPAVVPNGQGLVIVLFETILMLGDSLPSGEIVYLLLGLLTSFGIPLLLVLNLTLISSGSKIVRTFYALLLLYLLPAKWYGVFHIDEQFKSIGYWAGVILVSSAVLLEVVFFMRDRHRKTQLVN